MRRISSPLVTHLRPSIIHRFFLHKRELQGVQILPRPVGLNLRSIVTHLSPTTSLLRSDKIDNEVYLIGTAHVSDASSKEVVDMIQLVRPKFVFVELDEKRANHLRRQGQYEGNTKSRGTDPFDFSSFTRGTTPSFGGVSLPGSGGIVPMLQSVPALLKRIGWFPPVGGEMKAALDEADRIGAHIVCGDIEFEQTLGELKNSVFAMMASPTEMMKTFANLPPPPKELETIFREAGGSIFGISAQSGRTDPTELIESIKTREHAHLMTKYLSQCFPSIYHIMITKRDFYMASMLRQKCPNGKVVAVVGIAHMEGIERDWQELDSKYSQ